MFDLKKIKKVYMIGIGGISMSGIAHILKSWNFLVSGSNNEENKMTDELQNAGINVFIGHDYDNITNDIDLVVYTAAIKEDNPELIHAHELKIETMERGLFLGELTKLFKDTIGISGTHGKTTTTSMISECFLSSKLDPTIQVGSILKSINGNYRVGKSDYFIIEACEYCDSFLNFKQKSAIVLNIDNDHLDYFKTFDNIKKSFEKYVSMLPSDGLLVINGDDKNCLDLALYTNAKIITYGLSNHNSYYAKNIIYNKDGFPTYDLYHEDIFIDKIELSVIGSHNVLNSLACISLCLYYGLSIENIKDGLKNYTGAARRFEYKGIFKNAKVYDDYGHHPTEVKAVSDAVINKNYNKSWVIFEPHTFSRVKNHYKDFAASLVNFDHIIITDIYAARENNEYNVSPEMIINELEKLGKKAIHISDYNDIKDYLNKNVSDNDLILTLGAGYITKLSDLLTK